jgi:hypothetical protein
MIDEHGNIHIKRAHAFVNDFHWVMQTGKSISISLACIYYVTYLCKKNSIFGKIFAH